MIPISRWRRQSVAFWPAIALLTGLVTVPPVRIAPSDFAT